MVHWGVSSLKGALAALKLVVGFFPMKKGNELKLSGVEMLVFLDEVRNKSKKKVDKSVLNGTIDKGVYKRDGSSTVNTTIGNLQFLVRNFKLQWAVDAPMVRSLKTKKRRAEPSSCPSLKLMVMLEEYASNPTTPPIAAAHAGGWLAEAYSCSRTAQIQRAVVGPEFTDGPMKDFREGLTALEKHPVVSEQGPANFYICMTGIKERRWSEQWVKSLSLVGDGRFLICDTNATDGSPLTATAWTPGTPLTDTRARNSLRAVIVAATGMSAKDAMKFGCSSWRQFLPNVARGAVDATTGAALFSPEMRNELGRWAGSVARSIVPLDPVTAFALAPARERSAVMPDRYSAAAAAAVHVRAARYQISLSSRVLRAVGIANLPLFGGWEHFALRDETAPLSTGANDEPLE